MKIAFAHPALAYRLQLEAHMEVCGNCGGRGRAFRQDLDENRLVELMEADGDEEGLDSYRRGHYDETCRACQGRNVVEVLDYKAFKTSHPAEYKKVRAYERGADRCRAESAAERACFGS